MKNKLTILFALLPIVLFSQKNVIKTNLPGWVLLNFNGAYERALHQNFSIQISASYLNPIPFNINRFLPDNSGFSVKPIFTSFFITPEFRYYPSKTQFAPDGFYLAPWIRYYRYNLETEYSYLKNDSTTVNANANGSFSNLGLGGNLGYQFIIKKHFSIDLFAGLGLGAGTVKVRVKDSILTPDDYEEIAAAIGGVNFKFPGFSVYYNLDEAGLKFSVAPVLMLRAGLAIGFAF